MELAVGSPFSYWHYFANLPNCKVHPPTKSNGSRLYAKIKESQLGKHQSKYLGCRLRTGLVAILESNLESGQPRTVYQSVEQLLQSVEQLLQSAIDAKLRTTWSWTACVPVAATYELLCSRVAIIGTCCLFCTFRAAYTSLSWRSTALNVLRKSNPRIGEKILHSQQRCSAIRYEKILHSQPRCSAIRHVKNFLTPHTSEAYSNWV